MRKGYLAEREVKKLLSAKHGKTNVLKLAIGQAADFLVLKAGSNEVLKIVEVKKWKGKYRQSSNKSQWERIRQMSHEHNIPAELWVGVKGSKQFEVKDV